MNSAIVDRLKPCAISASSELSSDATPRCGWPIENVAGALGQTVADSRAHVEPVRRRLRAHDVQIIHGGAAEVAASAPATAARPKRRDVCVSVSWLP